MPETQELPELKSFPIVELLPEPPLVSLAPPW
jgi:hypothetical protein